MKKKLILPLILSLLSIPALSQETPRPKLPIAPAPLSAQPAQSNPQAVEMEAAWNKRVTDIGLWMMGYYKNKDFSVFSAKISELASIGGFTGKNSAAMIVFVSEVLKANPSKAIAFASDIAKLKIADPDQKALIAMGVINADLKDGPAVLKALALPASTMAKLEKFRKIDLASFTVSHPAHVDMLWAAWFATGNPAHVNRIIDVLATPEPQPPAKGANFEADKVSLLLVIRSVKWSSASIAKSDPAVKAVILKRASDPNPNIRSAISALAL